jgi:hypothetical protein
MICSIIHYLKFILFNQIRLLKKYSKKTYFFKLEYKI